MNLGSGGSKSCQVQRERAAEPTTLAAGWLWKRDSDLIRRWRCLGLDQRVEISDRRFWLAPLTSFCVCLTHEHDKTRDSSVKSNSSSFLCVTKQVFSVFRRCLQIYNV